MKVVAFNGSPRKDGNTARLITQVFTALQAEGIETELIQVGGQIVRGCTACYQCGINKNSRCVQDDAMNGWIQKMIEADGIILGSPTYFADITPELKALIDRSGFVCRANGQVLKRKVGTAVVAVRRAGAIHAVDSINHFFLIQQMIVPGSCYWPLGFGRDKGEVEKDEEGQNTMKVLGENMAWLLKKTILPSGTPA
jgi:multimeric flavodoxin WrbA